MSSSSFEPDTGSQLSHEQLMSALFANLVIQQTNTALILLGREPNPETGESIQDLEAAKMFIDQLEMLETKTKGNLDSREDRLLKQSLTSLRMAFVEAVEHPRSPHEVSQSAKSSSADSPHEADQARAAQANAPASSAPDDEDHRKKFSKKY